MISPRSTRTLATLIDCAQRLIAEGGEELRHGDPALAAVCTELATMLVRLVTMNEQRLATMAALETRKPA